jgi:beta-glucosidase/6-phospho-beta-glucosidase/beta-galactosidase
VNADDPSGRRAFAPGTFTWLLGIEDTCIYPPDGSDAAPLDEHVLTGHDQQWAADLDRAAALGATAIRYGVSWPLVHLGPGTFEWSRLDERLAYAATTRGLTVVADLVHYGCPPWLTASFADARFPAMLTEFAAAFAARYHGIVDHITPVNEPLTTASFCGLRGVWPPYLTGWDGWCKVTLGLVQGAAAAIRGIRSANPNAVIVHVEAAMPVESADPSLSREVEHLRRISYLPTDLLLGRVDTRHPLWAWLVQLGVNSEDLTALTVAPPTVDLLGVNYYPELSARVLTKHRHEVVQVSTDHGVEGLIGALRRMGDRYGLPMVVTETSIEGNDDVRQRWLELAAATCMTLTQSGVDVRGLTWWPVFDFVDWSFVGDGQSVEEFLVHHPDGDGVPALTMPLPLGDPSDGVTAFFRRMGLIRLEEAADGSLVRRETAAASAYRTLSRADHRDDAGLTWPPAGVQRSARRSVRRE